MMTPRTCGAKRSYTWSTRRLPRNVCRPLSTPPMRLPLPPARISPVTEDCKARSPLRHHRRRDGLPEAVLAGEEQVVFSARRAADHGDSDLVGDLVAHLGEARAGNKERDAHLRGLDHHLRGKAPGGVENLVRAVHAIEPHLSGDRVHGVVPADVFHDVEDPNAPGGVTRQRTAVTAPRSLVVALV